MGTGWRAAASATGRFTNQADERHNDRLRDHANR